jgi:hypothetical protein
MQELHLLLANPSNADGEGGMELVELFGQHLLTKEAGRPLRMTDVVSGAVR